MSAPFTQNSGHAPKTPLLRQHGLLKMHTPVLKIGLQGMPPALQFGFEVFFKLLDASQNVGNVFVHGVLGGHPPGGRIMRASTSQIAS